MIHKKRRWRYEWEAKEVVLVAQGLFGMKRTMGGKREEQTKGLRKYKRGM
jgi:hypothetical protein